VKQDIHPEYFDAKIKCVCGNVVETRASRPEMSVEVCSKCHPFYTGQQKLMDTEGRVERFNRKYGVATKK
jgi:large subunit ribosomal protein L31